MHRFRLPRFQLHLSTCVVLMLGASTLLIANLMPQENHHWGGCLSDGGAYFIFGYGWPCAYEVTFYENRDKTMRLERWSSSGLLSNVFVAALILSSYAVGMEAIIRKRRAAALRK